MTETLRLDAIDAYYGPSHVLHGVSLKIDAGEAVVLIGRNGAGKSSTMRTIMGLVRLGGGDIRLRGSSIKGMPTHRIARLGIGLVPDTRRMFAALTVAENLELGIKAPSADHVGQVWDVPRALKLFPALEPRR